MSRNREIMSDSSEEDDEVASEEESDSGLKLQQTQSVMMARQQLPPPSPTPSSSSSSSEEEESETESDSDPDLMHRPLASKPVVVETQLKPAVRTIPATNSSDAADVVTPKRDIKNNTKKSAEPEASERKSNLFQRIWSEDDEIVILKGMIHYLAKYRTDPTQDINTFYSFIKEDLQVDGTRTQLIDKIRRMRRKFEKKIKNGKEPMTFSKPHEKNVYDLSKQIWGNKEKETEVKKESEAVVEKKRKRVDLNYRGAMTVEEKMMMFGGDLFEPGEGLKGEKEWKKLRVEEFQNYLKQLEIRVAQTKLVLAAMMKHS
ncbi:probable transcription factor At1g61730 [Salvia splendens]|nr:probable transcription factor At1g61730 [Salvia splendens]